MNGSRAPDVHDTGNSTVPNGPFVPWPLCSCSLASLPFGSNNKQKAHKAVVDPFPIFPTLGLLTEFRLPSILVLSVQTVNPAAVR